MRRMLISLAVLVGYVVSTLGAGPVTPPECGDSRYYVLLFGGQADRRPNTAHTWAAFVRTTRHPNGIMVVESFTISWLPEKLPVRPLQLQPVPGRNYGLHETLDNMCAGHPHLSLWGPWEITPKWYCEAAEHKAVLDSGAVRYRVLVRGDGRDDVAHCVHAITKTDPILAARASPILWFGELVTRRVATAMTESGILIDPQVTHDWLIPALGIEQYPLTRRCVGKSESRFFRGPVASALGGRQ